LSEPSLPPFIKWSNYKSTDENNPDILELKVVETETFDTEYSVCVKVLLKKDQHWSEAILTLKSHNSANGSFLKLWIDGVKRGTIRKGTVIKIATWLGTSKNGHPIRRFRRLA
jgi:hypothetical protein